MGCLCLGSDDSSSPVRISEHADSSSPARISGHAESSSPLQISEHAEYISPLGPRMGERVQAPRLVGKTAQLYFQLIRNCLDTHRTLPLCVYGIAGSGKTAIMMNIYNQLLEAQGNMIFISVRRYSEDDDENIRQWQDSFAYAINADLPKEPDVYDRAEILHKALDDIGNCVIIMDDVSVGFRTRGVLGFGLRDSIHQVVLIARFKEVGHRELFKERAIHPSKEWAIRHFIWVDLRLSEEEAGELFMERANTKLTPQTKDVVAELVKECACLPLLIVAVAGALRGKEVDFWKECLHKLRYSAAGMMDAQSRLYKSLEFDWVRQRVTEKMCFLYCALYPKHWKISTRELVDYFHICGIVFEWEKRPFRYKATYSYKPKSDLSFESISINFEECHEWGGGLKMHPLYRDFALIKASQQYMSKCGLKLTELPNESEWGEYLEGASFMCNDIRSISVSPICPMLSTLFLNKNPELRSIANGFFVHMEGLKILDLRDNVKLEFLPDSVSALVNLRALRLSRCSSLKKVPSLEHPIAMEILEFDETAVKELPQGIGFLVPRLRVLKLHSLRLREPLPSWFLELLPSLPDLDLEI